ncbi:sugar phosphate isomerase/epimerase family protein [Hyunsoonleella pacifica]|uniref:Sugar phosphate isomerase/epimerase n=1 Tax=Hyunsoonleella pacifica TaxID=1080224 RepID=A0A4Q9FQB5_9FLAO|nr:sugar phosphate isomerase/epimerase family protein [Hyunsoonleella pacifica]TBN16421.1 sugar phosphate isomerase/epimerase [Hyunsoonleella pacifica]GGD19573.1 xylose isomerase [Hyunsoonleella pacifica]
MKTRRHFLKTAALTPLLLTANKLLAFPKEKPTIQRNRLQYSVNAYSFNTELRSGEMSFFDMMEFCAELGMDAVDLTGYYFSSYPETPSNKELFALKRKALDLGLDIAWTGVRNNFVTPNISSRNADKALIKDWLEVSSKLGATIMRVFTGKNKSKDFTKNDIKEWLVSDYKTCAKYGEEHGVIVGLQNHDEFLFTSDEIIDIIKRVNSDWFGLVLDCGSLPSEDPYEEMKKLAPYANYWFVKEHVKTKDSTKVPADLKRIAKIIQDSNFQGYVSFESLQEGNTKAILKDMFSTFKSAL